MDGIRMAGVLACIFLSGQFSRVTATDDVSANVCSQQMSQCLRISPALKQFWIALERACNSVLMEMRSRQPKGQPSVFIAVQNSMVSVNVTDLSSKTIATADQADKLFVAVDYDPVDDFLYWTTSTGIKRSKVDGTGSEKVLTANSVGGLAIDWIARNMYWTDANLNQITVSKLDGRYQRGLIKENIDGPRGIAVNPKDGELYWTEWGKLPRIAKASLDGSNAKNVTTMDIAWPNGIALDFDNRLVYFADAQTDKIEVIGMDGSGRKVVLDESGTHKFGLSYSNGYLYWTDWKQERAERMRLNNTPDRDVLLVSSTRMFGIKATYLDPPSFTNPCSKDNGGCAQFCFYTPGVVICG